MSTLTLAAFLLARIAEDERVARAAQRDAAREPVSLRPVDGAMTAGALSVMENVARWHPSRVLAECAAKRAVVERWQYLYLNGDSGNLEWVARALAQPYADHPDYGEAAR